ncbi:MAG: hypothetical protein RLZZ24_1133, partial [Pseudomonadota bacterium]
MQARTQQAFGTPLAETSTAELNQAVAQAHHAFETWQSSSGQQRAQLLDALASALEQARDALVTLADEETALGPVRLNGELDRTAFQLRRFARLANEG